jgi:hypothetical protein
VDGELGKSLSNQSATLLLGEKSGPWALKEFAEKINYRQDETVNIIVDGQGKIKAAYSIPQALMESKDFSKVEKAFKDMAAVHQGYIGFVLTNSDKVGVPPNLEKLNNAGHVLDGVIRREDGFMIAMSFYNDVGEALRIKSLKANAKKIVKVD